jgi:hypothetical protein
MTFMLHHRCKITKLVNFKIKSIPSHNEKNEEKNNWTVSHSDRLQPCSLPFRPNEKEQKMFRKKAELLNEKESATPCHAREQSSVEKLNQSFSLC